MILARKLLEDGCHVHGPQIGAVAALDRDNVQQAAAWNAHLQRQKHFVEARGNCCTMCSTVIKIFEKKKKKREELFFNLTVRRERPKMPFYEHE